MTAAGYGVLGVLLAVGAAMVGAWVWRARQRPLSTAERVAHWIVSGAVLGGIVIVPVVAKPGNQPGWSSVITGIIVSAVVMATRDAVNSPGPTRR